MRTASQRKGFTLVELLILTSVVVILSLAVFFAVDPEKIFKQTRDRRRASEVKLLSGAVDFLKQDQDLAVFPGDEKTIYVSVPDPAAPPGGRSNCSGLGFPVPPSGWSFSCANPGNFRNINGSGWVPIDFTTISAGSFFSLLPIDPANDAAKDLFYAYVGGAGYAVAGMMESEKFLRQFAVKDGGTDMTRYEKGDNLALWAAASGLAGYWPLNQNLADASGNNHEAIPAGTSGGPTWATGILEGGLFFNHSNRDFLIFIENSEAPFSLALQANATVTGWYKWTDVTNAGGVRGAGCLLTDYDKSWNLGDLPPGGPVNFAIFFRVSGAQYQSTLSSSQGLGLNNAWHHFAITKTGGTVTYYLDGSPLSASLLSGSPGNTSLCTGGTCWVLNRCGYENFISSVSGFADEVRIYNRPLTPREMSAYYAATHP